MVPCTARDFAVAEPLEPARNKQNKIKGPQIVKLSKTCTRIQPDFHPPRLLLRRTRKKRGYLIRRGGRACSKQRPSAYAVSCADVDALRGAEQTSVAVRVCVYLYRNHSCRPHLEVVSFFTERLDGSRLQWCPRVAYSCTSFGPP